MVLISTNYNSFTFCWSINWLDNWKIPVDKLKNSFWLLTFKLLINSLKRVHPLWLGPQWLHILIQDPQSITIIFPQATHPPFLVNLFTFNFTYESFHILFLNPVNYHKFMYLCIPKYNFVCNIHMWIVLGMLFRHYLSFHI